MIEKSKILFFWIKMTVTFIKLTTRVLSPLLVYHIVLLMFSQSTAGPFIRGD